MTRFEVRHGDCLEILRTLEPNSIDSVVTDPPYGIGKDGQHKTTGGHGGRKAYDFLGWDASRPPCELLTQLAAASPYVIMWGGNYFADLLPPTGKWLVWDKGQRDFSLADFEMAWSSQWAAARVIDYPRALALQDGKEHPTQKPVEVMRWCLGFVPDACVSILDPFMGSGTTGVACASLGRNFTGIEVNPAYFEISCRRIADELSRPRMFVEAPKPAKQEAML